MTPPAASPTSAALHDTVMAVNGIVDSICGLVETLEVHQSKLEAFARALMAMDTTIGTLVAVVNQLDDRLIAVERPYTKPAHLGGNPREPDNTNRE